MSVHPTLAFEDDVQRQIYEYVERHGAVSADELARAIRVENGPSQSKPARSATYVEELPISPEQLRTAIAGLKDEGYLIETGGKLRVALSTTPTHREVEEGRVTIRPAREEDREGLIDVMREVAREDTYIVAENAAEKVERESAIIRANEEQSRVFFVAVLEREPEAAADRDGIDGVDEAVVGWLHIDAPELPSLRHTAELTVGVVSEQRRQGIGSTLLEYGLEWADTDYRKIYQSVPATNERAIEFLEVNDWQREGEREDHYLIGDEFVDEVMLAAWP